MIDKKKGEVKYSPEFFIDDMTNLLSMIMEKIELMGEIEFSLKQKSQIAGLVLGIATSFGKLNETMKKWGFLS